MKKIIFLGIFILILLGCAFGGLAAGRFYDSWEVPVIWDEEGGLLGINYESLDRLV
jgi:hypothetical protein